MEECKYEIKKNEMENLTNSDFEAISSDNETDSDFDNDTDNESDNEIDNE